jgi:hypothetical protein
MEDRDSDRERAIKRLKARRDFRMHLGAYLIVNAMLVGMWALSWRGHFWPGWLMVFWGVGLAFHGWWAYFGGPISVADIRKEMGDGQ